MFTFHHGFWIYLITRRHPQVWQFVLGSMLPDYVYFVLLGIILVKGEVQFADVPELSPLRFMEIMLLYPWVINADLVLHSVVIWGLALIAALLPIFNRAQAFVIGWGTHLFVDGLTHGAYANQFLYPLSTLVVHSPISYWEPEYFAREYNLIHNSLLALAAIYLLWRWWRRKRQK